jgi:hypothetical protein
MKDKLTNMRPKDREFNRWPRPLSSSSRRKSNKNQQIDPMYIDTSQFNFDQTLTLNEPTSSNREGKSDANSVHSVDDLIDLNDEQQHPTISRSTLTNNIHSSPNLQQTSSNLQSTDNIGILMPNQSHIQMDKSLKEKRNNWERFD